MLIPGIAGIDKIKTAATGLVITLAEFKKHLKTDSSDTSEDTLMTTYLGTATIDFENFTGRQTLAATWQLFFDKFYSMVTLSKSPVVIAEIVVKYYDSTNSLTTLAATEYKVRDGGEYGLTQIEFDGSIPSTYDKPNAVYIEYGAGYTTVPDPIKLGIMFQAADYYEGRQTGDAILPIAYRLWYPYKTFYHNVKGD